MSSFIMFFFISFEIRQPLLHLMRSFGHRPTTGVVIGFVLIVAIGFVLIMVIDFILIRMEIILLVSLIGFKGYD